MTTSPGGSRRALTPVGTALVAVILAACGGGGMSSGSPVSSPPAPRGSPEATDIAASAAARDLILATTTSTLDSGLLDVIMPAFEEATGHVAKTVAVGSGQALKMGAEGNADVLLVHSPAAERELVASGAGIDRQLVMHNSFLVVGPPADPAGIRGLTSVRQAFARVVDSGATFVSRGDDSGTHAKELGYWQEAELSPAAGWYLQTGQGMAGTLRIASEKAGYTIVDIATWAAIRDQVDLEPFVTEDPSLLNPYHVIRVNPERWPLVNAEGAKAFAAYLLSPEGQGLIGAFGRGDDGLQLFVPDAGKTESDLVAP